MAVSMFFLAPLKPPLVVLPSFFSHPILKTQLPEMIFLSFTTHLSSPLCTGYSLTYTLQTGFGTKAFSFPLLCKGM